MVLRVLVVLYVSQESYLAPMICMLGSGMSTQPGRRKVFTVADCDFSRSLPSLRFLLAALLTPLVLSVCLWRASGGTV